jgi:hypothetical protein
VRYTRIWQRLLGLPRVVIESMVIEEDGDEDVLVVVVIVDLGEAGTEPGRVVTAGFPGFGLRVGLLRAIYERVQRAAEGQLQGLGEDVQAILSDATLGELDVLPDGTTVTTEWADAIAIQDWSEESTF